MEDRKMKYWSVERDPEFLEHYGIKGMRWRRRKRKSQSPNTKLHTYDNFARNTKVRDYYKPSSFGEGWHEIDYDKMMAEHPQAREWYKDTYGSYRDGRGGRKGSSVKGNKDPMNALSTSKGKGSVRRGGSVISNIINKAKSKKHRK